METLLAWLTALPPAALYAALALSAAVENIFPPFPADTVVAFGSFLAARGHATLVGAFLSTWLGNVAGAMAVYGIARRFGAEGMRRWTDRIGGAASQERMERLYAKRGIAAIFLSRFVPGLRAIVPPFAGALRVPALPAFVTIAVASGLWYGTVTIIAYRVGANLEALQARMRAAGAGAAIGAAAVGILLVLALIWRRRSRQA